MLALSVVAVGAAVQGPMLAGDYTADVTMTRGGVKYQGVYKMDASGKRMFKHVDGLEENTYVYQAPGRYITYIYNNNTAGCDCAAQQDGLVAPWERLRGAAKIGSCSGGDLFESSGKTYIGAPMYRACISPDGTPVYEEEGSDHIQYNSFTTGRPDFPLPDLLSCQSACNENVLTIQGSRELVSGAVESPPLVAPDFTADVTFTQGGLSYKGRIMHDRTGRRSFKYTSGLEEYTYTYQVPGRAITQTYTNNTSGCYCLTSEASQVDVPFPQLYMAVKAGACGSGALWVGQVQNLVDVAQEKICVSADGIPLWTEQAGLRVDYNSFTAGRPSFPSVNLQSCQAACNTNTAKNAVATGSARPANVADKSAQIFGNTSLLTRIADFTAEVTLVQTGLSYKGRMMVDNTGKRSFTYISGLEQYTYFYQIPGAAQSYRYTNLTSGCVCANMKDELVGDFWSQLTNAVKTGTCDGGELWEDDAVNLLGVGNFKVCIDTATATPLYTQHGGSVIKFDKFTIGRPDFPVVDFTFCQTECTVQ